MSPAARKKAGSPESSPSSDWGDRIDQYSGREEADSIPLQGEVEQKDFLTTATDAVRSTANAVAAQASDVIANVGDEVSEAVSREKQRGAESVLGIARAITTAADELGQQSPALAGHLKSAARSIESLSDGIKERTLRELTDEAGNLARRQPVVFFAGAVLTGFTLARFLKSSAPRAARPESPLSGGTASGG